jgi:hypothetical protein
MAVESVGASQRKRQARPNNNKERKGSGVTTTMASRTTKYPKKFDTHGPERSHIGLKRAVVEKYIK